MRARHPRFRTFSAATFVLSMLVSGCANLPWTTTDEIASPASDVGFEIRDVPAGWCTSELQLTPDDEGKRTMTVESPDGTANVIASSEPLGPGIDTREYADSQGELLADEFDEYRELEEGSSGSFDGSGRERVFTWAPPDGAPVWQAQAYAARDGVGYTATGTNLESAPAAMRRGLRDIVDSVRIVSGEVVTPARCDDDSPESGTRST